MRIVSLVPGHTETLFALGLGEKVVGVTAHCDYPPQATGKEQVGLFNRPDVGRIISLRPDLVLAGGAIHRGCVEELRRAGVTVFDFAPRRVAELLEGMEEIVRITRAGEAGRSVVATFRARVAGLREKVARRSRIRVLFVMGEKTLVTPGPASCQYDALRVAGAELLPAPAHEPALLLSRDGVRRFNPEVILACGRVSGEPPKKRCPGCDLPERPCVRDAAVMLNHPLLTGVDAVEKKCVHAVPCHWLCRPGPRLIDGMERVAQLLQKVSQPLTG
ncbi:ABC transporter substrate-binding protein [Desulfofundulus sp. TPOSR]|uniref:ABC transporter substrate-binding protein n=1 Tax=Desulfofundulus sp. TPOSR TaxID=2714340 RepID=UPI00140CAE68|nr:helical backbone metal receptor [Desulfofundulus sp. TPOSR]NHM26662.1 ABC transporter substrate-binding protein [Desulfofundulus sp. TPOSR]